MATPPSAEAAQKRIAAHARAPLGQDRSLRHEVERYILTEVKEGRLRPGDRLLEVDLARTLEVSLTPVREAIFRLVHFGQVIHQPRRGFYLARLDAAQSEDVYSMRAALEGLAASCAATRTQPDELRALEDVIEEGERALRAADALQNAECNARFHSLIVRAARHALLERAWQMLSPIHWLQLPDREPRVTPDHAARWAGTHRRLLDAIKSGDPQRAERAAREHIGRVAARSRSRPPRASEA